MLEPSSSPRMALRICLPLLNHNLCRDSYRPTSSCPRTLFGISLPRAAFVSTPRRNSESSHNDPEEDALGSHCLSKRKFNLVILAAVSYGFVLTMKKATLAEQLELERYTDSKEGFTLLRPSSWNKVPALLSLLCLAFFFILFLMVLSFSLQTNSRRTLLR